MLPATALILLILAYGLVALVGAADLDLFEFDIDVDADTGSPTSVGMAILKFLNLGDVPIIIWLACFGLIWWAASLVLWVLVDGKPEDITWGHGAVLILRNLGIGLVGAKGLTEPLQKMFDETEHYTPGKLIGAICEVTTSEVTEDVGQAKVATDAAPLLIDVRARQIDFEKGDLAMVVGYDEAAKTYQIEKLTTESDE